VELKTPQELSKNLAKYTKNVWRKKYNFFGANYTKNVWNENSGFQKP
jgi:hypothetical protein